MTLDYVDRILKTLQILKNKQTQKKLQILHYNPTTPSN